MCRIRQDDVKRGPSQWANENKVGSRAFKQATYEFTVGRCCDLLIHFISEVYLDEQACDVYYAGGNRPKQGHVGWHEHVCHESITPMTWHIETQDPKNNFAYWCPFHNDTEVMPSWLMGQADTLRLITNTYPHASIRGARSLEHCSHLTPRGSCGAIDGQMDLNQVSTD